MTKTATIVTSPTWDIGRVMVVASITQRKGSGVGPFVWLGGRSNLVQWCSWGCWSGESKVTVVELPLVFVLGERLSLNLG